MAQRTGLKWLWYTPLYKRFKNIDGPGGMTLHCWPFVDLAMTWDTDRGYRWGPMCIEILVVVVSAIIWALIALAYIFWRGVA